MERYRLKNIIILILTLLNVFLLGVLLARKSDEVSLLRRTEAELVALFDASGVTLEKDAISWDTPPAAVPRPPPGPPAAPARFRYETRPVSNAAVTFRLEEGQVTAASGTLLSAETVTPTSESSKDLLSAAGALTAFQQMRQAESTVASSIQETYLCYELQSASLTLESTWCIVTEIARY